MPRVIQGDSKIKLQTVADNSVDLLCTDHPYRYGFMGKSWDKIQDFTPIWEQCFRTMKPGAFGFIMNAPRSDCQLLLLSELAAVGFNIKFSPILWCYNSGFPKAGDTSKLIDKRFGLERETIGTYEHPGRKDRSYQTTSNVFSGDRANDKIEQPKWEEHKNTTTTRQNPYQSGKNLIGKKEEVINGLCVTKPACPESAKFEGSKVGHQMKPAFEVVTVVMKPLNQKTYIDQALHNGKGVTWIDDCRIPYGELNEYINNTKKGYCGSGGTGVLGWNKGEQKSCKDSAKPPQTKEEFLNSPEGLALKKKLVGGRLTQEKRWTYGDEQVDGFKSQEFEDVNINLKGRYPANLLVSDNMLDQGIKTKASQIKSELPTKGSFAGSEGQYQQQQNQTTTRGHNDSGDVSRYYSLDAWWAQHIGVQIKSLPKAQQQTFPFLFVSKASKSEKNKGLNKFETKQVTGGGGLNNKEAGRKYGSIKSPSKNTHPTGKPIQLMSYLITLGSRPGDIILDPFAGSGTTGIACKLESRDYILIELMPEYYDIMKARLKATQVQQKLF